MNSCQNCKWSCYETYQGRQIIYCNAQDICVRGEQEDCEGWEEQA